MTKNITKKDIFETLSNKTGFSSDYSKKVITNLLEIICELIKKNDLSLKNIGSFNIIDKKERVGRNPKTKEEFLIKNRKSIRFTISKNFSKIINNYNE